MQVHCPKCQQAIPDEDFNVSTDLAYCRSCKANFELSQLIQNAKLDQAASKGKEPDGTWCRSSGRWTTIGASHRSILKAFGLLFMCLFWNGIVSVFVLLNLASTLHLLGFTPPTWFPAPEMDGGPMGVGMTLFLWLFLTPFILIGSGLLIGFLLCLAGKTEIEISPREGRIFTGIGPIGWTRKFDPSMVEKVELRQKRWSNGDGDRHEQEEICLELSNGKTIKFGSSLEEVRKHYLGGELRSLLAI